ncbi:hypothetical protein [Daejeonella sp. H1SJ63]|uniref:hypothetical protein n=1 Tax=Daejeonella sp. H1SJ63 TaxID=3034145 RepID=UPI0023EB4AB9|nr:hypothetical protein [Daejeonella sp. H1SJ63]
MSQNSKPERYSSRYTRGFLKMLNNDGQTVTDNYFNQFYESKNYQERLEAIRYLINVSGKYPFSSKIFIDALKDFCSQVKIYVLQHYDFQNNKSPEIELRLEDIAKNDEKLQLRALAIERLSEFNNMKHYDLFFSASLLKSSKESAEGLKGLYNLNAEKAYQMAKFRTNTSSGNLDLAIANIFYKAGNASDLDFFRQRLKGRNKFNKIEFARIYLKMLVNIKNESIIKSHILFICEDIIATSNKDLIQLLIMELHKFISGNQLLCGGNTELNYFLNKTIDLLLEKNYKPKELPDPFGPV